MRFQNVDVEVVAIINDAVGTLMSTAHSDRNCQIGLILGTGCNACYMEDLECVGLWDGQINNPKQVFNFLHYYFLLFPFVLHYYFLLF
jgi:hypothetical protein